jgi:hypothetical protein
MKDAKRKLPIIEEPPAAQPPKDALPTVEEVTVERVANEKWRVVVARYVRLAGSEKVLEDGVSLPVARATAQAWRAKHGGLAKDIP